MSKLSNAASAKKQVNDLRLNETVTNFMGGDSYVINPLDTLKMISASSILGEPSYYRSGRRGPRYFIDENLHNFSILPEEFEGEDTETIMEKAIDNALDFDFGATLEWAKELRHEYYMRLNPQVIMTRAAIHPKRCQYTAENPGKFNEINQQVMLRPDEPMTQMAYFIYANDGKKSNMPSLLKRSWAQKIEGLSRKNIAKYKNHEIGMINAIRLCHANSKDSDAINELMKTGTVEVEAEEKTWENLRAEGKPWKEIFETLNMGHMALLRNIRGVFTETEDADFCREYMDKIKEGVRKSKQFPFRYFSAIKAVKSSDCFHKPIIIEALEECMDIAVENYPKLKGKTICLSDNSGSAWGCCNSEYGSVRIAEINNLSSVLTAACSDEGYVGKFGDELKIYPITKREGMLSQTENISKDQGDEVGLSTEGGIWEFFKNAINNKEHWDNIFIYSDMQAGHGQLYGTGEQYKEYKKLGFLCDWHYINVFALIQEYRKKVNPKVNVFSIQTAGYDNNLIPEYAYRTNIMYGWTGKEAMFAQTMINQWDEMENRERKEN